MTRIKHDGYSNSNSIRYAIKAKSRQVRLTVECTLNVYGKNCPRDDPRLYSRHATVGKINIRARKSFSGFALQSGNSFLLILQIYLRQEHGGYYFPLAACRESELITKEKVVPKERNIIRIIV